jgi:hypothetical protein
VDDDKVRGAIRLFLVRAKLRQRYLIQKAEYEQPPGIRPTIPEPPDLDVLADSARRVIASLREAAEAESRVRMERERDELEARLMLAKHIETVKREILRLSSARDIDAAIDDCKTYSITLKEGQVAKEVITEQLRSNFLSNLSSIGMTEPPVEVVLGPGEHGKHPYEMKLVPRPEVPPQEVLSEGERTCVAIAGFLAELQTTGNHSAIVFDDPVSSLDHHYRKQVAERVVLEAKARQVIIFTHDIVFLYLVRKYSAELGIDLTETSLHRGYKGKHARATEGPPWIAMPVNRRLGVLREALVEARKDLKNGQSASYEQKVSQIYRGLRQTWERAVEEVLLNSTVLRFGDAVRTQQLKPLTDITDSDIETITREMSRCSDYLHDESGAVYAGGPEPDVVDSDIKTLHDWVDNLRKNRKRTR